MCLAACGSGAGKSDQTGVATNEDFALALADTVNHVILPTYADLHEKAVALQSCTQELTSVPNAAQLATCQRAWVDSRVPFEQSESFLFGPATNQGFDTAMDSWPVDRQQLEQLLASSDFRAGAEVALRSRGVHAAEEAHLLRIAIVERQRGVTNRTFLGGPAKFGVMRIFAGAIQ